MPSITNKLFIDRVADYLANLSPTPLARSGSTTAVFSHESDDDIAAPIFSVLRAYDTALAEVPTPHVMLQLDTRAGTVADAMQRAEILVARLLNDDGRPARMLAITGFVIVKVLGLRPPRHIANDEKNRAIVTANFELNYRPA